MVSSENTVIIPTCKILHDPNCCNACWARFGESCFPQAWHPYINWGELYLGLERGRIRQAEKFRKQQQDLETEVLGDYQAYLVTLSLDKSCDHLDQMKVIKEIQKTGYKSILSRPSFYSMEYYGSTDLSWNPHIHIFSDKIKTFSQTAQPLQRKFINDRFKVYRVNVVSRPATAISDYIAGEKTLKKSEAISLDKEYRSKNNIPDFNQLF